jgi:hypothetical protein
LVDPLVVVDDARGNDISNIVILSSLLLSSVTYANCIISGHIVINCLNLLILNTIPDDASNVSNRLTENLPSFLFIVKT